MPGPQDDQSTVLALLDNPATYGADTVERIETHASFVFLAGERAYKLKRAIALPYMDYSTPAKRGAACRAEVRLNRRTAPKLYLGVAPVLLRNHRLALGEIDTEPPDAIDWVVVMARFDQAQLFDRLAEQGELTPSLMRKLAEVVAAFHSRAEPRPGAGGRRAMVWVIEENLVELREHPTWFDPDRVRRLDELSRAALDRTGALLDRRSSEGFVRQCHGDLHLRNICLIDGEPTLFDAIEFSEAIAIIDVLYDLAFLLMDLEYRALRTLGNVVFNRYLEIADSIDGLAALPLFLATRAAIRAKVTATAAAVVGENAAERTAEARRYFDLALRLAEPRHPRLIAIGGLSGSGKTTAARLIAPEIGAAPGALVLRSDIVRKRRAGVMDYVRLPESAYTSAETDALYDDLRTRCLSVLKAGHSVIVDAVHAKAEQRAALAALAHRAHVPFAGFWLDAPEDRLIARVESRRDDASDASAEIVRRQLDYELGTVDWVRIDASGRPEASASMIRDALHQRA